MSLDPGPLAAGFFILNFTFFTPLNSKFHRKLERRKRSYEKKDATL